MQPSVLQLCWKYDKLNQIPDVPIFSLRSVYKLCQVRSNLCVIVNYTQVCVLRASD